MIFEELVRNGMIKKSVVSKFDEFKGEVSCSASALREEPHNLDPPCGLGDIRQVSDWRRFPRVLLSSC